MAKKVRSYHEVIDKVTEFSGQADATVSAVGTVEAEGNRYPIFSIRIANPSAKKSEAPMVLITGGIHGDEPGGVWAVLEFLNRFPDLPEVYRKCEFTVLPCTNPFGFEHDTRQNNEGIDLNRQFRDGHPPVEVQLVKKVVAGRAFDLTLEFHEDVDSPGFYLYELMQKGESSWGKEILGALAKAYPINRSGEIEGTTADSGLILRHDEDHTFRQFVNSRADWPQAFYHFTNGSRRSYTTETPTSLIPEKRTEMHLKVLDLAVKKLWEQQSRRNP
jgi:protein MpaA